MTELSFVTLERVVFAAGGMAILLLLWRVLGVLEARRDSRLDQFAEHGLLPQLVRGYAPWLRAPLNLFVLAGVACLILAFAEPRWGEGAPAAHRGSREILVLLDTSESMNAANPAPSRLARAQTKISALLEACPGDRFGLVAFSGAAALQCPLTRDHAYFKTVLQSITTDSLTAEGTDIEAAFNEAKLLFEDELDGGRGSSPEDRIILLISDGEEVSGNAVVAARSLSAAGRIAVLGIGDPEGAEVRLPQWMQRTRYAPGGPGSHWSVLDEATLSAIALAGRGVYVRSTLSGEDVDVILREMEYLDGFTGGDEAPPRTINRYRWPLAAALALFAAEGVWLVWMPYMARRRAHAASGREAAHALG